MKNLKLLYLLLALFLLLPRGAEAKKVYIVKVTLKSGEVLRGKLMTCTKDSLIIETGRNLPSTRLAILDIRQIRIHRRGSIGIGMGIGAGLGAVIGGMIGLALYTPSDCSSQSSGIFCGAFDGLAQFDQAAGGALLGALGGSVVGLGLGSAGREFKIEGRREQFELFVGQVGSNHH